MREQLEVALIAILIPLLPLGGAYIRLWINVQIANLKKQAELAELEEMAFYLDEVDKMIAKAVLSVQQTFVDDLKEKGLFTEDKHKEALLKAKAIVESLLTEHGKIMLEKAYADYNAYIENTIEELVGRMK